jgi:DNA modification methylase
VTSREVNGEGRSVPRILDYKDDGFERLTHYIFRYPAKFHPPVVRSLISKYTTDGQIIFDPFVGSGTLLIEAVATGRSAVGLDIDPVAVAISSVKSHR